MKKFLHIFTAVLFCLTALNASAQDSEITTVLDADFTQFTEGSPESPVAFPSYGTGSFTSFFPSWYAYKVLKAGGSVMIQDGGRLQTSSLSLSANNGIARVTVRMRAMDSYGAGLKIALGYSSNVTEYVSDSEWHDITVILSGGSISSKIEVSPQMSASGILIQSIKVEQSPAFFPAPVAYQPSSADETSFTANWSRISGATGYFIDVYSYALDGSKEYFIENEACTTTYKSVSGLDASKRYYFVVRATNGTSVSDNSNEIEVIPVITSIDTPAPGEAIISDGRASFSWPAVDHAEKYIVNLFRHTTLSADTEMAVINDDFSKVNEGSFSTVEFTYPQYLDKYTNTPGWDGSELALAEGNIVLTPFSSTGHLSTPLLDLSANEGKLTATFNIAEGAFGTYRSGTEFAIRLIDAEGNTLEEKTFTTKSGYDDYTADFTKGTDNCAVAVYYSGSYKLFISAVSVSQVKPAGSVFTELFLNETTEDTSFSFDYAPAEGVKIGYTVTAVGTTVVSGDFADIYSEPSEERFVETAAAIAGVVADNDISVSAAAGVIYITSASEARVAVYDMTGRCIADTFAAAGTSTIACDAKGVVIVRVNDRAFKVIL